MKHLKPCPSFVVKSLLLLSGILLCTMKANAQSTVINKPESLYVVWVFYPLTIVPGESIHTMTYTNTTGSQQSITVSYMRGLLTNGTITANANGVELNSNDENAISTSGTATDTLMPGKTWQKISGLTLPSKIYYAGGYNAAAVTSYKVNNDPLVNAVTNKNWAIIPHL